MRKSTLNTSTDHVKEKEHNVGPILNPQAEAIRLSEIRGNDVAASNAVQDVKSIDASKRARNSHTESGALKTGPLLSRNASRIPEKKEQAPIIESSVLDKPLTESVALSADPERSNGYGWNSKSYPKKLSKPYRQNDDKQSVSLAKSRKTSLPE